MEGGWTGVGVGGHDLSPRSPKTYDDIGPLDDESGLLPSDSFVVKCLAQGLRGGLR